MAAAATPQQILETVRPVNKPARTLHRFNQAPIDVARYGLPPADIAQRCRSQQQCPTCQR